LAEDEFRLTETGKIIFTRILINYFALVEQMTLSPAHVIAGVEKSLNEICQVIISMWPLLCFSTDTAEISQFNYNCAQLMPFA
jgi:hypothetical protein